MWRCIRTSLIVLFVVPLTGCGMSRTHPPSASDVVPVETVASVAGVWKGTTWKVSHLWTDGDLMVNIEPGGSYVAWRDRGSALAADAGRLVAIDGKLLSDSQRLLSSFSVAQCHGNPILVVEVIGKDNDRYYVPLVRAAP